MRATRVVDAIVDGVDGQKTGIQISSDHEGALALLRIPDIKPGKVDTPNMKFRNNPREVSAAAGPVEIAFKGTEHVVESTQVGIVLNVLKSGTRETLLTGLSAQNPEDENIVSLLWAGDLDRDGKLDLLFAYSGENKYGACLYLSAGAGGSAMVKQAACHGGIGC